MEDLLTKCRHEADDLTILEEAARPNPVVSICLSPESTTPGTHTDYSQMINAKLVPDFWKPMWPVNSITGKTCRTADGAWGWSVLRNKLLDHTARLIDEHGDTPHATLRMEASAKVCEELRLLAQQARE